MNRFLQTVFLLMAHGVILANPMILSNHFVLAIKNATSSNLTIYMPLVLLSVYKNTPNLAFPFPHSFHHYPCPAPFYSQHTAATKLKEVYRAQTANHLLVLLMSSFYDLL